MRRGNRSEFASPRVIAIRSIRNVAGSSHDKFKRTQSKKKRTCSDSCVLSHSVHRGSQRCKQCDSRQQMKNERRKREMRKSKPKRRREERVLHLSVPFHNDRIIFGSVHRHERWRNSYRSFLITAARGLPANLLGTLPPPFSLRLHLSTELYGRSCYRISRHRNFPSW